MSQALLYAVAASHKMSEFPTAIPFFNVGTEAYVICGRHSLVVFYGNMYI
jgi:hypothetical protein